MLNNFIKDIVQDKKGNLLDFPENEILFCPYIIQRFISMYSLNLCYILNEVSNKRLNELTKKQFYNLMLHVIPRQKSSYVKYFKVDKEEFILTDKQKLAVEFLCNKHNTSYREVKQYIQNFDLDIDFFK